MNVNPTIAASTKLPICSKDGPLEGGPWTRTHSGFRANYGFRDAHTPTVQATEPLPRLARANQTRPMARALTRT